MENLDKFAKWFKDNPTKVLGKSVTKKGTAYDSEKYYTTVISDVEKLYAIDVPDYKQVAKDSPTIGTLTEPVTATNSTPEEIAGIKKATEKTRKKNVQIEKANQDASLVGATNLWSYDEVDEEYNGARYDEEGNLISKAITEAEKQAYALYINRLSNKPIEGGFAKYSIKDTKSARQMLMEEGVLCFDNTEKEENRQYKPTFYYASGNVRVKLKKLEEDKDFFIENFNEKVYNLQYDALVKANKVLAEKKLSLTDPDKSKRIFLNIKGDFVKTFKVNPCNPLDEKSFDYDWRTWWQKRNGEIQWKVNEVKAGFQPYKRSGNNAFFGTYKLTLKEAFSFWLYDIRTYNLLDYGFVLSDDVKSIDEIQKFFVEQSNTVPEDYKDGVGKEAVIKEEWWNKKQDIFDAGQQLFSYFLANGLQSKDRILLEQVWNQDYNSQLGFDTNRVPILFRFVKKVGSDLMDIRPEKRRAISFNMLTGSSCLAYGVGMGKTFCSIFTLGQNLDLGLCKKPIVIVPNSVYPQFLQEIKTLLPQYKVNGLFNLRGIYTEEVKEIKDNTITIVAYSGLEVMGFKSREVGLNLFQRVKEIVDQGEVEKQSEKKIAKQNEKIVEFLGLAQVGADVFFDEVGFDYLCVDEAHNFKNLLSSVKGKVNEEGTKRKSSGYTIKGSRASRAVKMFALAQYVQMNNINGNCLLLTATPFTNTPLEVYSIMSLIRYEFLKANGFGSVKDFFDFYADVKYVPSENTKLQPIIKQVVAGFRNVVSMQGLIYNLIDKPTKQEEAQKVVRPNKIVLPMWDKRVGDNTISVSKSNQVTTLLRMTEKQKNDWTRLYSYADGKITYSQLSSDEFWNTTKCGSIDAMLKASKKKAEEGEEQADYDANGIRAVFSLTYGRAIALNPYLYRFSEYKTNPTPAEYVQASPKIEYTIECIKTVQEHHKKTKTPMSGQVIYMASGTSCFDLVLKYISEYLGFSMNELGIIAGGDKSRIGTKKASKDEVQDAFLGRRLDLTDPKNPKYVSIPDNERVKVIVGSGAIKEGVNLQYYSTCLYNCEVDWNPTDMAQLEGRIWRQKNAFANVRIVVPLLENSHDSFMYSTLKEKTGRINQIWERDGSNEFDLDELDPQELQAQVSRNPITLATRLKAKQLKEINSNLATVTSQQSIYREVRKDSGKIIDVYNRIERYDSQYRKDNALQSIWNVLNTFRPSLITMPLVKDMDLLFKPTPTQERRALKINPDALNYSFEELDALFVKFKKEQIIEYPRGYVLGWEEAKEKPKAKFIVGEKIKFSTRRGEKEGVIETIINPNQDDAQLISYDVQVGSDPDNIVEDVTLDGFNMESLDNPIEIGEAKEVGGIPLLHNLGTKAFIEDFYKVYRYYRYEYNAPSDTQDMMYGIKNVFQSFYSWDWNTQESAYAELKVEFASAPKLNTYIYDTYLKGNGYSIDWTRWLIDIKKYWETNLKPKGINNEDDLTNKLSELKNEVSKLEENKKALETKEKFEEFVVEAEIELKRREAEGDKPLSPRECAKVFATPNPDYLGNELLDIMQEEIKEEEPKEEIKEAEPKEEETKEISIFDKKIKLLSLMGMSAKGKDKEMIDKKLKLLNLMKMAS